MSGRKKYSKEFKLDAVSLVLGQDYSRVEAARSLGLNSNILGRWVSEHQTDGRQSFRGTFTRGRDWVFPATGIAATALVVIHSLFDFSLQMPGIVVSYAAILGVACAQSYSSQPD